MLVGVFIYVYFRTDRNVSQYELPREQNWITQKSEPLRRGITPKSSSAGTTWALASAARFAVFFGSVSTMSRPIWCPYMEEFDL